METTLRIILQALCLRAFRDTWSGFLIRVPNRACPFTRKHDGDGVYTYTSPITKPPEADPPERSRARARARSRRSRVIRFRALMTAATAGGFCTSRACKSNMNSCISKGHDYLALAASARGGFHTTRYGGIQSAAADDADGSRRQANALIIAGCRLFRHRAGLYRYRSSVLPPWPRRSVNKLLAERSEASDRLRSLKRGPALARSAS
jgi:hypothetical protein